MKRTFLFISFIFFTIGLGFPAYGVEMAAEPEPVESAILLFEPDLFAVPSSVALPAWIARVGFEGGDVGGGSSAWRVAESAPMGTGKLWVELDRSVLDENLALSVVGERKVPSDMVIQLWDGQGRIVALDLFGNITAAALESRTDTFVVPLWKYPSATRIVLRRVSGATTIYGLALIPVVMEQDIGTNTVEALQFARMLGDLLSPENELVRRVRVISNGRSKAGSTGQDELVVAPTRVDTPVVPDWRKGLLAFYSFSDDEGARVSDQSGKKRDGKVVDAEWTADGRLGGAMRFGPTNSYVVASDEGLPMGGAVRSIAFWMKLGDNRNLSNPLAYGTLRYNQNFSMGMDWRLGRNSICIGQHGAVNVASKKFETGSWYHIVYTYGGGSEHRFYIDGVEDILAVCEFRAPLETVSSGSLYLGLRAGLDSAAHSFDGWLDEVMIYDRALAPAEVRQLYEQNGTKTQTIDLGNGVPLEMTWIPPGRFRMGSTQAERDWAVGAEGKGLASWYTDESDPVDIDMTNGFWMGKTPVTIAMFRRFVEATGYRTDAEKSGRAWGWNSSYVFGAAPGISWRTPGFAQQDNHPVVCVSWADAMAFCEWLTGIERDAGRLPAGKEFRLPGEAEWEYGARGGREGTKFWWGDVLSDGRGRLNAAGTDKLPNGSILTSYYGWEDGFAFTSPVDHYGASGRNGFGLADMLGNVWQWCYDRYDRKGAHGSIFRGETSYGVLRGGAFDSCRGGDLRSANRGPDDPPMPLAHRGFRVVLADVVDAPAQVDAPVKPAAGTALKRGLFFVAGDSLYRMNMDGTDCVVVAPGASGSRSLAVDPVKKMIYMTTWDKAQILGYDIAEGGPLRQLHSGIGSGGMGLGYDPAESRFFVGLYYRGVFTLDAQQSGTWQHIVTPSQISPMLGQRDQLQLDLKNKHAYFRTAYNGYTPDPLRFIWRVNYDGTGLTKIIRANDGGGLALDVPAGHLYFTDGDQSSQFIEIKRANLDGTDSQTILNLSPLPYPYGQGLELDLENRKMYIYLTVGARSDAPPRWEDRAIGRANLDGSDFELLWQKPGIGGGNGLAIVSP